MRGSGFCESAPVFLKRSASLGIRSMITAKIFYIHPEKLRYFRNSHFLQSPHCHLLWCYSLVKAESCQYIMYSLYNAIVYIQA